MSKKVIPFLFAFALIGLPALAEERGGLRYTVSVAKFENNSGWHGQWDIGDAWGAVMTDLMNQTGRLIVLGETDMRNEAMAEQDLVASGRTAQGRAAPRAGQLTPAQLLVKGVITHVQRSTSGGGGDIRIKNIRVGGKKDKAEINVTVYVVESTTGQVLASKSVVGKSDSSAARLGYSGRDFSGDADAFKKDNVGKAIEDAVGEAVDWIVTELPGIPWTATVALVKDDRVYINRGTREGVAAGQLFVVGDVEVIRDPDTGEVLDESVTEVARLQVQTVKEKLSICIVTSGDPALVEAGMAAHLP